MTTDMVWTGLEETDSVKTGLVVETDLVKGDLVKTVPSETVLTKNYFF